MAKDDWRRTGQEAYLMEAELQYIDEYVPHSGACEHENCCFCSEKISADEDDLNSGYCTIDGEERTWICSYCFDDFQDEFRWKVQEV
ncbi:MAG: hypothetical protein FWE92_00970 [Defluviitaleaceae bacterium]|nr:hypothetical protein [Defluviitaleaceae bacterium]